ncbi:hypothetical protein NC99_41840 [Sunxiuqinia dokdonensis]|uniref:Uncharacterized protein n=1 Tax=Sunxiuqinia dokdonensis TaxID=1409788 RepID=A0A0L8V3L9_9BACT|nr:hypothetical protein NC99_41840 [Sunxiuqinia dokdonensis]
MQFVRRVVSCQINFDYQYESVIFKLRLFRLICEYSEFVDW